MPENTVVFMEGSFPKASASPTIGPRIGNGFTNCGNCSMNCSCRSACREVCRAAFKRPSKTTCDSKFQR